ncbi:MAG: pseudouridine synthase, partial [Gammaproteobacteria bacterium]|nr:pseudouridine synthase [Gammaproteobacteria bacterium]
MFDIVHEDARLVVLDKASGVSVLADRTGAPCLWDALKARYPHPRLVHRIDKGTSGLLLVALTRE